MKTLLEKAKERQRYSSRTDILDKLPRKTQEEIGELVKAFFDGDISGPQFHKVMVEAGFLNKTKKGVNAYNYVSSILKPLVRKGIIEINVAYE